MYIRRRTPIRTDINTHRYTHTHVRIHMPTYVCILAYLHTYVHTYVTCTHTYICTYTRNYTYIRASPSLRLCFCVLHVPLDPRSLEAPLLREPSGGIAYATSVLDHCSTKNVQVWTDMTAGSNGMSSTRTSYTIQTENRWFAACVFLPPTTKHDTRSFLCPDTSRNWLQPVRSCTHQATLEHQKVPHHGHQDHLDEPNPIFIHSSQLAATCVFLSSCRLSPDGRFLLECLWWGNVFFCWRTSTLAHSLHCTPNARNPSCVSHCGETIIISNAHLRSASEPADGKHRQE